MKINLSKLILDFTQKIIYVKKGLKNWYKNKIANINILSCSIFSNEITNNNFHWTYVYKMNSKFYKIKKQMIPRARESRKWKIIFFMQCFVFEKIEFENWEIDGIYALFFNRII